MLWIISSLVFILLRVAPGDPVDAILGSGADEVSREFLRNKLGLNVPLVNQYFSYIKNILNLDFGHFNIKCHTNRIPIGINWLEK